MAQNYKFKAGKAKDRSKSLATESLPNWASAVARAKALSRQKNDFVGIYVEGGIIGVVHTQVIDGVNQFFGDGVYTCGGRVE